MTEPRDPFEELLTRRPVEPLPPRSGAFERISRTARHRRWTKAAGAAAAVLVLLTGVAGVIRAFPLSDNSIGTPPTATGTGPSGVPRTSAPASPTAPSSASGSPSPGHSQSAQPPGGGICTAAGLQVKVVPGSNAAGHIGLVIVFTNTSAWTCTMDGHPGVSFVTGPSGTQVGEAAQRAGTAPSPVTLAPNGTAHANLLLVNVANYPPNTCKPKPAAGVRVYPPDNTTAVFASSPQQICTVKGAGIAQVYSVEPGG
jgi:Protein of unknown function (DUF4232)